VFLVPKINKYVNPHVLCYFIFHSIFIIKHNSFIFFIYSWNNSCKINYLINLKIELSLKLNCDGDYKDSMRFACCRGFFFKTQAVVG